jgi:hypothetical protein
MPNDEGRIMNAETILTRRVKKFFTSAFFLHHSAFA